MTRKSWRGRRAPAALLLFVTGVLLGGAAARAQVNWAAMLISVQGATTIRRSGAGVFINAHRKMTLDQGDLVRTGPNGRAGILFADGSQAKLNASTTLLIPAARADGGIPPRLGLSRGELWARIVRGRRVRIETPTAVAGVRGTDLNLQVAEDGTATLTVGEGEVHFTNEHGSVSVRDGQQSVARPGRAPTPPVLVNVPFIIEWAAEVQPVALLLETAFAGVDRAGLDGALRAALAATEQPGERAPAAWRRLGDVRHDRGELPEALAAYERALALSRVRGEVAPNQREEAELEARIGQTLLEMGRLPEAEAAFRRALEREPGLTGARSGLVMALLSRRQNADALVEARAAVARDERSPLAHTTLALALIRRGEREAARAALQQALALDAAYAPAHAWQSFLLRAEGRSEEAETAARRAVELAPSSSLARQSLSDAAFALGRNREAREHAGQAVSLNPLSPGARVSLGRALLHEGQLERAVSEAHRAVALDPELERARFFYGVVLAEQRRLDRSAAELRRAVELDPEYLEARAFLARVYLEQGRNAEAIAVVREAMAQDPDFAPARASLGRVLWRAGRLNEAAAEYRRALELAPESAFARLELARVYLDQNNLPDALAQGLAAVTRAPASSEAHAVLGLIYDRMENREQAVRAYRDALSFSPENALARMGVGLYNPDLSTGLFDIAQSLLYDPTVPSLRFRPGVTTQLAPGVGSDDSYTFDTLHRDQFLRGKLHDISFSNQRRSDNYRDGRREERTFAMTNLAAAPNYRTHLLGQFIYDSTQRPLPGSIFAPDANDRSHSVIRSWDLSTRYQVGPDTFVWLHASYFLSDFSERNPDAPRDGGLRALSRSRTSLLGLEGRLDHRWGRGHTTSYLLAGERRQLRFRDRAYDTLQAAFVEGGFSGREQTVRHALQDHYRPGSRLALVLGITSQRSASRFSFDNSARTHWLPYGQVTYVLTPRDTVRVIAHERRSQLGLIGLHPTEAFVVGEAPPVVYTERENLELQYEHRFSERSFAKLFLFRGEVQDLTVFPTVGQSPTNPLETVDIRVPRARVEGIGLRYERQLGRFLSSYMRLTYSETTDETARSTRGWQLPMHPRTRALLGLNYIDRAGSKLFLEANWQSRMFIDPFWSDREGFGRFGDREGFDPAAPRPRFPSRLVIDLRLAKEPSVRHEWVLRINNLLNTNTIYWPGFPAPGRTFQVQYLVRF